MHLRRMVNARHRTSVLLKLTLRHDPASHRCARPSCTRL